MKFPFKRHRMSVDQTLRRDWMAHAQAAGLEKALSEFPADVAEAARAAAQELADMPSIEGTTEPWPTMRLRREP